MNTFDPSLDATCIMCPRKGKHCNRCKNAMYCSKEYQKLDWGNHKSLCSKFISSSRPSPKHRRALLFPGSNLPPRFQWVRIYEYRSQDGSVNEDFHSYAEFGTEEKDSNSSPWNPVQNRSQARVEGEALHWFKKYNMVATDTANVGLRNFTRGGACWQDFRGPVFVLRAITDKQGRIRHLDMDMRDARGAADFLSQTYRDGADQEHLRNIQVLGTSVACDGKKTSEEEKFKPLIVNGSDTVWNTEGSGIANLLGLPLLSTSLCNAFETSPAPALRNESMASLYIDVVSTSVLPAIKPPTPGPSIIYTHPGRAAESMGVRIRQLALGRRGFGSSSLKYSMDTTGQAYIVRADGKPFPPQHAEALCGFIKDEIEPKIAAAISGVAENELVADRENILQFICRKNFEQYYKDLRAVKIQTGDDAWRDLPTPYEIDQDHVTEAKVTEILATQQSNGIESASEKYARQERGDITTEEVKESLGFDDNTDPAFIEFMKAQYIQHCAQKKQNRKE